MKRELKITAVLTPACKDRRYRDKVINFNYVTNLFRFQTGVFKLAGKYHNSEMNKHAETQFCKFSLKAPSRLSIQINKVDKQK